MKKSGSILLGSLLFLISMTAVTAQLDLGRLFERTGLDAFFVDIIDVNGQIAEPYGLLYLRIILFIIIFALFYGVSNVVLNNIERRPRIWIAFGLGLLSVIAIPKGMLQLLVTGYATAVFVVLSLVLIGGAVFVGHKIGATRAGRFFKGILFIFAGYFVESLITGGLATLGGVIPVSQGGFGLDAIQGLLSLVGVIMVVMGFWYVFTSFGGEGAAGAVTSGSGLKSFGETMSNLAEGKEEIKKGWRNISGKAAKEERLSKKIQNLDSSITNENQAIISSLGELQRILDDPKIAGRVPEIQKVLRKINKRESKEAKELRKTAHLISKWERLEKLVTNQLKGGRGLDARIRKHLGVKKNLAAVRTQLDTIRKLIGGANNLAANERANIRNAVQYDAQFRSNMNDAMNALATNNRAQAKRSLAIASQAKVAESNAMGTIIKIQSRLKEIEKVIRKSDIIRRYVKG